jgi:hypothetical protein
VTGVPVKSITYQYDAAGNRVSKSVINVSGGHQYTYYVRDGQGNVLAVYTKHDGDEVPPEERNKLYWAEQNLYGSSRIGIWKPDIEVGATWQLPLAGYCQHNIGDYSFEVTNHLGNVIAVISDKLVGIDQDNNSSIDYYDSEILSAVDYYPFGMLMPGRNWNVGNYRYGFNGKEHLSEAKGW